MKTFLLVLLLGFTNQLFAQSNLNKIDETQIKKLQILLPNEIFDKKSIEELDLNTVKMFELSVSANSNYIKNLVDSSEPSLVEKLKDPLILAEAVEVKNVLEKEFTINQLEEMKQFISKSLAAEAKFPIASASGASDSNVFAVQYIAYREFPQNSGTYLGYGLYMTIDTSSLEGSLSSDLPFLVASATVANKRFTFSARLIGFEGVGAHKLLLQAMPGSNFSIDTYVGYESFKKAVISGMEDGSLKISPVPVDPMFVLGSLEADSMAISRIHALISIAKRLSLADALESYDEQTTSAYSVIKGVYKEHANIKKFKDKPSQNASKKAKGMISRLGITI